MNPIHQPTFSEHDPHKAGGEGDVKPDGGAAEAARGGKPDGGGADAGASSDDPGRGGD
jgi:hypothetical protein